ncbi:hypothetical protein CIPAW_06G157100 [Carya illinoinensis]|uniref:Uncharacterized protein n=1 Tax=Carya illinoinensis TaxID=32201 RepID=A0A8T1QCJ4_CARIL|nr:hypothetical protein CIPAW_06G157100 [Carya illinoinensis]
MSPIGGIAGNENNGGGNLSSGYVGRLGMIPPGPGSGGRAGSARPGIAGKVVVGAKSFRVDTATSRPGKDRAMKNINAKAKVREDAMMNINANRCRKNIIA